jgi:putative ABC transport system substrate-binding protein
MHLRKLSDERVDVVIVLETSMLLAFSRQIAASALKKRLSTVYGYREHVLVGGWARRGFETSRILPRQFDRVFSSYPLAGT